MKISIMGTGYVGLSTGIGFAKKGNSVLCFDVVKEIVEKINRKEPTFYEPLIGDALKEVVSKSQIIFKDLPKDDPAKRKPDITKARKRLGWSPEVGLEEGLKKTIGEFGQK